MVPRPYVSQDPIEGRPEKLAPVFIISSAGSWLGISVYTERTKHMSSTHSARLGKISLTSMPLFPCFLNLKGDFIRLPVLRSCCRSPPGIGCPWYLSSEGL